MASLSWKTGLSGLWTDAADWSSGTVPTSSDDVTIAVAPALNPLPYTILINDQEAAHSVTQAQGKSTLSILSGTLSVATNTALSAGVLSLNQGTLHTQTLTSTGGTLLLTQYGSLTDAHVDGTLTVAGAPGEFSNRLDLSGDSFSGVGGTGMGALVLGAEISAAIGNAPTLDSVSIALNGASLSQDSGLLTFGSHALVVQSAYGTLGNFGFDLTNDGQIAAASAQAVLMIDGDMLTNAGTISASNGGSLFLNAQSLSNSGKITVTAGSYLHIEAVGPAGFTNTGTVSVTGGTLSLDTTLTTAQLAAFAVASGTLAIGGVLNNAGATLRAGAGTPYANLLLEGGTITGGTLVTGANFSIGNSPPYVGNDDNELSGVTVDGPLDVSNGTTLSIADSLTLLGASESTPGTVIVTAGSTLSLLGDQTIDTVRITLGDTNTANPYATSALISSDTSLASTLTLGPDTVVQQGGYYADIAASDSDGTVFNQGTILADTQGYLSLFSVVNGGVVAVSNADTLSMDNVINTGTITDVSGTILADGNVTNTGVISLSGAGATYSVDTYGLQNFLNDGVLSLAGGASASLGTYGEGWTNAGTFIVTAGELSLGGSFTLAELGTARFSAAGTLGVAGTLLNTGTLSVGSGTALPTVMLQANGSISGGVIKESGGGLLSQGGTLAGVTVQGPLQLAGTAELLNVSGGLTLTGSTGSGTGSLAITGAGSDLIFDTPQTLAQAAIAIGGSGAGGTLGVGLGQVLTLASSVTVTQAGAAASLGSAGGTLVNQGHVTAGLAGGTLSLLGSVGNAGSIAVSNGETLALDVTTLANTGSIGATGSLVDVVRATAAQLATVHLTDSDVAVTGTLVATGATLAAGAGGTISALKLSGDLVGGTIHDGGGAVQFAGASTLDGVTYQGALTVDRPFATVTVTDGLSLTTTAGTGVGSLSITGPDSEVVWDSTRALDTATLAIGSNNGNPLYADPALVAASGGPAVLLGAHLSIHQAALYATIGSSIGTFSSAATLTANVARGRFTLAGDRFTNTGTIGISNTDTVSAAAGGFTNAGLIVVGTGSALDLNLYDYFASANLADESFTNTGSIQMAGGMLAELTDNGAFPNVPLLNAAGASIGGAGIVASQIDNDGTVEAKGGVLNLVQTVSGTGTLKVDSGAMLVLGGVGTGQTASFGGAGGVLGLQPAYFLGEIGGFAAGDTIDLFNTAARSAAFSGSSLTVTLTSGAVLHLATTTPMTGALTVTAGTHGDSLIHLAGDVPAAYPEVSVAPASSALVHDEPPIGTALAWVHSVHPA